MTERRAWPILRRLVDLSAWALSWLEDKRDGHRRLSGTRLAVAVFTVVFCARINLPLGWPDAFLGFCILFAIPIGKALDRAPAQAVVEAVTGMFGKPAGAGTYFADTVVGARAVDDPDIPRGTAEVS